MTSHHVTCHVTAMSRASSLSLKEKEKEKENQKKSRKIDKKKKKNVSVKAFHNNLCDYWTLCLVVATTVCCKLWSSI